MFGWHEIHQVSRLSSLRTAEMLRMPPVNSTGVPFAGAVSALNYPVADLSLNVDSVTTAVVADLRAIEDGTVVVTTEVVAHAADLAVAVETVVAVGVRELTETVQHGMQNARNPDPFRR